MTSRRAWGFAPWIFALFVLVPQIALAAPAKRVVIFVGMPGSGKSTAATLLAGKYKAPKWSSGDVIRSTIAERGLTYGAEVDRQVAEEFARKPGAIGTRLAEMVAKAPGDVAIVEGFRALAELKAFKKAFPLATVVAVEVGEARRHSRMLARGRAGEVTKEYLRGRDRAEMKRGVRDVMRQADLRIRPGDTVDSLARSLRVVERLLAP